MRIRTLVITTAVLAIPSLAPTTVAAQDTTMTRRDSLSRTHARVTSERRIRVQKEANGDVAIDRDAYADSVARADSIERARMEEAARLDSIARFERMRADSIAAIERARQDSIAAVERARMDSIARADSIAREEQLRKQRMRDRYLFNGTGWYLGVSAGSVMPKGDFDQIGYGNGFTVNVPIGYHSRSHLLGARLDLGYSQFAGNSFTGTSGGNSVTLNNSDPKVFSAVANLTMRLPLNASRSVNLYGVGGGGLFTFRSFGQSSSLAGYLGNDVLDSNDEAVENTRTKFGAQAGAGIDFGVGPTSIFLETRWVSVNADRGDNVQLSDFFGNTRGKSVRWVPIVVGLTFR
ncbi:MAG: hypothetical protein ABIZ91_05815 [Gemmatimonadaceae bacterium]